MGASERVGFRPPLTSVLPVVGVLVLLTIALPNEGSLGFLILCPFFFGVLRLRQLLVLNDEHLEVTTLRTRRIPWEQVEGFRPGSTLRGGTQILTTDGVVHSTSPCSWWGGPADAADIATLQRMRASRGRKS